MVRHEIPAKCITAVVGSFTVPSTPPFIFAKLQLASNSQRVLPESHGACPESALFYAAWVFFFPQSSQISVCQ